jgi:very-short-patch-repair endonuclease
VVGEVEVDGDIRPRFQLRRGWWRVARLAANQHGVVARPQLLALGISPDQATRLVDAGHLQTVHRGVYAVGHRRLTQHGEWMAAVLAGGPGAVLSHTSAAMLWALIEPSPSLPHVTTPTKGRRRRGIRSHAAGLAGDVITRRDGIPVTTVARTLLDLATVLDRFHLELALAEAEFHRYPLSPSLPTLLDRHRGGRGVGALRSALASGNATLGVPRSRLEKRFLRFLDRRRLQRPELNVPITLGDQTIRIDCLWRRIGLAVELDGRAAHERRRTFHSDRRRDRRLSAHGLRPIRITGEQLVAQPDELDHDLRALGVDRRTAPRSAAPGAG